MRVHSLSRIPREGLRRFFAGFYNAFHERTASDIHPILADL